MLQITSQRLSQRASHVGFLQNLLEVLIGCGDCVSGEIGRHKGAIGVGLGNASTEDVVGFAEEIRRLVCSDYLLFQFIFNPRFHYY